MKNCMRWSFVFCLFWLAASGLSAQSQSDAVNLILDQAAARIDAFPELDSWQALVTSSQIQMDKKWAPKKQLVIRKRIHIAGDNRREDILEALETKKGTTRDITAEHQERSRKAEAEAEQKSKDGPDKRDRGYTLTDENLFPFSSEARKNYVFSLGEDSVFQGVPVLVLESRAKVPQKERMEGRYYLDRESLVVMRAELRPSKVPRVVKTIEMDFWFDVLPEGYLVVKKTRVKVDIAVVVKRIRILTEEEYSEYQVLEASKEERVGLTAW